MTTDTSNSNIYINMKNEIIYNSKVIINPLNIIPIVRDTITIPDNADQMTVLQQKFAILEQKTQAVSTFTDYMKNRLKRLKSL